MGREFEQLPRGWELPIPDSIWPEAMIAAVRADVGALAVPRVIETVRRWQADALNPAEPRAQREAKSRLRALGDALCVEEGASRSAEFDLEGITTALPDAGEDLARALSEIHRLASEPGRRPRNGEERRGRGSRGNPAAQPQVRLTSSVSGGEPIDDDAILAIEPTSMKGGPSRSSPLPDFDGVEPPTALRTTDDEPDSTGPIPIPPSLYTRGGATGSAPIANPFEAEDEKPTRAIPIPSELSRRSLPAVLVPADDTNEAQPPSIKVSSVRAVAVEESEAHVDAERTVAAATAMPSAPAPEPAAPQRSSAPAAPAEVEETVDGKGRLAPKPGIVRRRALSRKDEGPQRPRAAMQQVKALHATILPLCEELIPLSVERRSRRFWARWREVAGDRGVRREFVEELLKSTTEVRTLLCELIAEVQSVDPGSVHALVEKIETGLEPRSPQPKPTVAPERQRGPLVGASIRVEGVSVEEKK